MCKIIYITKVFCICIVHGKTVFLIRMNLMLSSKKYLSCLYLPFQYIKEHTHTRLLSIMCNTTVQCETESFSFFKVTIYEGS